MVILALKGARPCTNIMTEKYRATIQGGRIEWSGETPSEANSDSLLTVDVTVLKAERGIHKPDGNRMADALAKIAARGGVRSIPDPVKWQRRSGRTERFRDANNAHRQQHDHLRGPAGE